MYSSNYGGLPSNTANKIKEIGMYAGDSFGPGSAVDAAQLHDLSHGSSGMQLASQSFSEALSPMGSSVQKGVHDSLHQVVSRSTSVRASERNVGSSVNGLVSYDRQGTAYGRKHGSGAELPQLQLSAPLSLEEGISLSGRSQVLSELAPAPMPIPQTALHQSAHRISAHAKTSQKGYSRASTGASGTTTAQSMLGYRPSRGFSDTFSEAVPVSAPTMPTVHVAHTPHQHDPNHTGQASARTAMHPPQGYRELRRSLADNIPTFSYTPSCASPTLPRGEGQTPSGLVPPLSTGGGCQWAVSDVRSWLSAAQAALLPPHTPLSQPLVWQDSESGTLHMLVGTQLSPLPVTFMPGLHATAGEGAGQQEVVRTSSKALRTVPRPNYLLHISHSSSDGGRAHVVPLPPLCHSSAPTTQQALGGTGMGGAGASAGLPGDLSLSKLTPLIGTGEYIRQLVWIQHPTAGVSHGVALGLMGQYIVRVEINKGTVACTPVLFTMPWGASALLDKRSASGAEITRTTTTTGGTGGGCFFVSPDELRAVTVSPYTPGLIAAAGHDGTVSILQLGALGGGAGEPRVVSVLEAYERSVVSDVCWSSGLPDLLLWTLEGGAVQSVDVGPLLHKESSAGSTTVSRGRTATRTSSTGPSSSSSLLMSGAQRERGRDGAGQGKQPTFTQQAGLSCIVPLDGLSCPSLSLTGGLSSSPCALSDVWICGYMTGGIHVVEVSANTTHAQALIQQNAKLVQQDGVRVNVQPWQRDPAVAEIDTILPLPAPALRCIASTVTSSTSGAGQGHATATRPQVRARQPDEHVDDPIRIFACTGAEGWSLWLAHARDTGVELSCFAQGLVTAPPPPVSTDYALQCAAVGAGVPPAEAVYGSSRLYPARAHVNAAWLCDISQGGGVSLVVTDVYGALACMDLTHVIRNAVLQAKGKAVRAMESLVPLKRMKLDMVTQRSDGDGHMLGVHQHQQQQQQQGGQQQSPGGMLMPHSRGRSAGVGRGGGRDAHNSRSSAGASSRVHLPSPAFGGAAARLAVHESGHGMGMGIGMGPTPVPMGAAISASSLALDTGGVYPLHSSGLGMSVGRHVASHGLPSLGPAAGSGCGFLASYSGGPGPLGVNSHLPGLASSGGATGLGVSFSLPVFNAQAAYTGTQTTMYAGTQTMGPRYGAPPRSSRSQGQTAAGAVQAQQGSQSRTGHQGTASTPGPLPFSMPPPVGVSPAIQPAFPSLCGSSFPSALSTYHFSPIFAARRQQAPASASDVHGSSSVSASSSAVSGRAQLGCAGTPADLTAQMCAAALSSGMSLADGMAQ